MKTALKGALTACLATLHDTSLLRPIEAKRGQ